MVYVDDLLLISADDSFLSSIFESLGRHFLLKRILPVNTYLGIQLLRARPVKQLLIHEQHHIEEWTADLIRGSAHTALTHGLHLTNMQDTKPAMIETEHLSTKGEIGYDASSTWPDLSQAHICLSGRFPLEAHGNRKIVRHGTLRLRGSLYASRHATYCKSRPSLQRWHKIPDSDYLMDPSHTQCLQ